MTVPKADSFSRRDDVVAWLANMVLRLASKKYRALLEGAIKYGLASARRDQAEGREPPVGWLL